MTILFPQLPLISLREDYDVTEARRNIAYAGCCAKTHGLPEAITSSNVFFPSVKEDVVAIIGGGPSLKQQVPHGNITLLEKIACKDGVIKVLVGSAHRLLSEGDLSTAHAAVFNLPGSSYADYLDSPRPEVAYFLASQCDPLVFDRLLYAGIKPHLFHAYMKDIEYGADQVSVGVGSTAVTAALSLFRAKGYYKFEFYGVDGGRKLAPEMAKAYIERHESPGRDGYAYPMPTERIALDALIVETNGEFYATTRNFWEQTRELRAVLSNPSRDLQLHFHGADTLSVALLNNPTRRIGRVYDLSRPRTPEPGFAGSDFGPVAAP